MSSIKVCFTRWHWVAAGILAAAITTHADTIQLTSGQTVTGNVVKYGNGTFEVRSQAGKTENYPSSRISRIQFDPRSVPTKVASRNKGALEGAVLTYEGGGFVFNSGSTVEKLPGIFVDRITFGGERGKEVAIIARGQKVDLAQHLVPGNITIIDFYADWCGPCKQISPLLEEMAKSDPEIALRKVDIINWGSPVAKQFNISSIPRIEIYNRTGKLVGTVSGVSPEEVKKYVAQAKASG